MVLSLNWHRAGRAVQLWRRSLDFLTLEEGLIVAGIVTLGLLVAIVYDGIQKRRKK